MACGSAIIDAEIARAASPRLRDVAPDEHRADPAGRAVPESRLYPTEAYVDAIARTTASGRYRNIDVASLWMTWDMLREMRDQGRTIGGHTADHVVLARESEEGQRSQIRGCAERLPAELGEPMR